MIVLDASVLIAHLDERDTHHERASRLLAETGAEPLGASTITLAETLVAPRATGPPGRRTCGPRSTRRRRASLADGAPGQLARLRAETGCKLPDCCVLLAAREHGGTVASFDSALVNAANTLGLRIHQ